MTAPGRADNLRGIALMTAGMAAAASCDALIKLTASIIPVSQIIALIGFVGMAGFWSAAMRRGLPILSRDFFHPAALGRDLGEVIGSAGIITALALVPLSVVTFIIQSVPLLVTLGAVLFLGERAAWRDWLAMLGGLLGVLIIVQPGTEGFAPAALIAVLAACGQALRDLSSRAAPKRIATLQLAVWGFFFFGLAGAIMTVLSGDPVRWPAPAGLMGITLIIPMAAATMLFITAAMRTGDVAVISAFRYTRLAFGAGLGVILFSERLDATTLAGGAIIAASGLYAWHRQFRRRAADASTAPAR